MPVPQHLMSVANQGDEPSQPARQSILRCSHFVEHIVGSAIFLFCNGHISAECSLFFSHTGHPDCWPVGTLGGSWTRHASHIRPRPHQCLSKRWNESFNLYSQGSTGGCRPSIPCYSFPVCMPAITAFNSTGKRKAEWKRITV